MDSERKIINVVGAAIVKDGTVLCAQRGPDKSLAGYWEFPGGKIEPHETPRQALHREIEEELLCDIEVADEVCTSEYAYDFGTVRLTTFICHLHNGTPRLTEHTAIQWMEPAAMPQLNWAPVDRAAAKLIATRTFATKSANV
ncbi:(deoxy)nucleoside triphosphate pyrophosphohydrolase [Bifidobacterium imperatoris]|uniref:8-oxo-dGTP diphosphatase n=1 Tax=Bifidobacterium imperatoris TaxID=2020965 RepID=A0A2N5IPQ1_9BIFI|nr:(deoxy)nucleoside triphosphate pyrophosphohydrolase [Bifidobacterium imperatoris]PLS23933.1 DNA mismatch repair protein MutT [Bifidobacterium imperatoris]QSY58407.1 (deoxy)nucleoside triphosphate pyrophosphohydrolase [Bifidobacterium imperatoris]